LHFDIVVEVKMLFLAFLVSVFGFVSVRRTLRTMRARQLMNDAETRRIAGVMVFVFVGLALIPWPLSYKVTVALILGIGSAALLPPFLKRRRERSFVEHMAPLLTEMILSMRAGMSFRTALERGCGKFSTVTRHMTTQIPAAVAFAQQTGQDVARGELAVFIEEIRRIDQQTQSALERLKFLRQKIQTEQTFLRQRRLQSMQIRFQIGVLAALFILVQVFSYSFFRDSLPAALLLYANLIFGAGIFLQWRILGRFEWRI
jgi:Flp pilus assembly protein TadB